jgi:hypothetical protein
MKLAILLARSSEDRTHASVVGSPMPYDQAAKIFKDHVARREMPHGCAKAGFNVLELWTSGGTAKRHKFPVPVKPTGTPAKAKATKAAAPEKPAPAPSAPAPAATPPAPATEGDPVEKMAARLEAGEAVTPEDLAPLTVAQLTALATRYEIVLPEGSSKDDLITFILASE